MMKLFDIESGFKGRINSLPLGGSAQNLRYK